MIVYDTRTRTVICNPPRVQLIAGHTKQIVAPNFAQNPRLVIFTGAPISNG